EFRSNPSTVRVADYRIIENNFSGEQVSGDFEHRWERIGSNVDAPAILHYCAGQCSFAPSNLGQNDKYSWEGFQDIWEAETRLEVGVLCVDGSSANADQIVTYLRSMGLSAKRERGNNCTYIVIIPTGLERWALDTLRAAGVTSVSNGLGPAGGSNSVRI